MRKLEPIWESLVEFNLRNRPLLYKATPAAKTQPYNEPMVLGGGPYNLITDNNELLIDW